MQVIVRRTFHVPEFRKCGSPQGRNPASVEPADAIQRVDSRRGLHTRLEILVLSDSDSRVFRHKPDLDLMFPEFRKRGCPQGETLRRQNAPMQSSAWTQVLVYTRG
jgi:hypothetical protein